MKYSNWILPISVVTVILLVVFFYVIPVRENDREFEVNKEIRWLKVNNKLLKKDNLELTVKIDRSIIEADSLKQMIQIDSTEIQTLKKAKNEKMDTISNFSDDELYRFFATFEAHSTSNK